MKKLFLILLLASLGLNGWVMHASSARGGAYLNTNNSTWIKVHHLPLTRDGHDLQSVTLKLCDDKQHVLTTVFQASDEIAVQGTIRNLIQKFGDGARLKVLAETVFKGGSKERRETALGAVELSQSKRLRPEYNFDYPKMTVIDQAKIKK